MMDDALEEISKRGRIETASLLLYNLDTVMSGYALDHIDMIAEGIFD